jgi:hypothetical protein
MHLVAEELCSLYKLPENHGLKGDAKILAEQACATRVDGTSSERLLEALAERGFTVKRFAAAAETIFADSSLWTVESWGGKAWADVAKFVTNADELAPSALAAAGFLLFHGADSSVGRGE